MKRQILTIVVTYNGSQWIMDCLNSINDSDLQSEIIVVDNASSDNTVELIQLYFPEVKLVESSENLGFGRANNIGISIAIEDNFEYVFLLNQDAKIESNTYSKLVAINKEKPEYGVISPLHLNKSGESLDKKFSYYASPQYTDKLLSDLCLNKVKDIYNTSFVNAAAWLISADVIKKIGGFDPIFFHYGEDYNYCQRLIYHNFKVGIAPSARIYHDRKYSGDKWDSKQIFLYYLIKVADINNQEYKNEHKKFVKQDITRIISGLLNGNFKKIIANLKNIKIKMKYLKLVKKSRINNEKGGLVHLHGSTDNCDSCIQ